MDWDRLFQIAAQARAGRLAAGDAAFAGETVPAALGDFPHVAMPRRLAHPAGFAVAGRPVGTFARGALLAAGAKALGRRYGGSLFYERVEADLALGIMRSHFQLGYPKGAHCCQRCTLAVLPVLDAGLIRHFDCRALAKNVRRLIEKREWRFASAPNAKMLAWALGD